MPWAGAAVEKEIRRPAVARQTASEKPATVRGQRFMV
jgi:hypothetical protein